MIVVSVYNNKSILFDDDKIDGKLDYHLLEVIRKELAYDVPEAEWSEKYKQGLWDGKITLFNKKEQSLPTGLTNKLKELFELVNIPYKFIDKRNKPLKNYPVSCDFEGKELRDYQISSGLVSNKYQRGMLALCTGAGKTMTSCYIFNQLQVAPVVFIVPAIELLKQTKKEFERYLRLDNQPVKIGIAGGGYCDLNPEGINVITYQTALIAFDKKYQETTKKIVDDQGGDGQSKSTALIKKEYENAEKDLNQAKKIAIENNKHLLLEIEELQKLKSEQIQSSKIKALDNKIEKAKNSYNRVVNNECKDKIAIFKKAETSWYKRQEIILQKQQVRELIKKCQAFIVDEAHVASVVIEALGNFAENAFYKLGLSGTPWRTDNQDIRIEGALGRKIIQVSASDLIERGFLVQPKIFMVKVNEFHDAHTYAEIYNANVVNNWERNYRIKQFAEEFKKNNRPTLILVERREHGHLLESLIEDAVFVPGGDKGDEDPTDEEKNYRRRMLNSVEKNEIILIATQWANVGVDAPKISSLILAGSNQSSVTTYQQVGRVLRCVGKDITDSIKNGKPDAIIIDFTSDQKNMKTQSNLRKRVYKNERAWNFIELK